MRADDWLLHTNKTLTRQQLDNGLPSIDHIRRIKSKRNPHEGEERKLVNAKITNRGMNHTRADCPRAREGSQDISMRDVFYSGYKFCLNGFQEEIYNIV